MALSNRITSTFKDFVTRFNSLNEDLETFHTFGGFSGFRFLSISNDHHHYYQDQDNEGRARFKFSSSQLCSIYLIRKALDLRRFMGEFVKLVLDEAEPSHASLDRFTAAVERLHNESDSVLAWHIRMVVGSGEDKLWEAEEDYMLHHFNDRIEILVREVVDNRLSSTKDTYSVIREIFERCYRDVGGGVMDGYEYNNSPYNSDIKPEDSPDHLERFAHDESYARWYYQASMQRLKIRRERQTDWLAAWVAALNKLPRGPTLFNLETLPEPCPWIKLPRYLFRVYDGASSGRSDKRVVASVASVNGYDNSRVDLLLRNHEEAAAMLHTHLNVKGFFRTEVEEEEEEGADNLMSWTSSLLFAIQYAFWRFNKSGARWPLDEVMICAVDTRLFPIGQFVRDMDLIKFYKQTAAARGATLDPDAQKFFDFRLNRDDYDNGEFLSQGEVYHAGRSVVFSYGQLIRAGLFDLYPELEDPAERGSLMKRVKALRAAWSADYHPTTRRDIQIARQLARACFKGFDESAVALMFLTLKKRKFKEDVARQPLWNLEKYGPQEVQRFMEVVEHWNQRRGSATTFHRNLKDVFELSVN